MSRDGAVDTLQVTRSIPLSTKALGKACFQDEVATLRSDIAELKEGEGKRRRLNAPGRCTCEHRPVSQDTWLDRGASCFVETKPGSISQRFAQTWSRKLGYQLSTDKAGRRLCRQHVRSPLVLDKCAVCLAAA